MNVFVNGKMESLSMIDPKTGTDFVKDFIGNYGALSDGQFTWNEEIGAFEADQETFNWWNKVISDQIKLDERVTELKDKNDSEEVDRVVNEASDVDLEDLATSVNAALDKAFGESVK